MLDERVTTTRVLQDKPVIIRRQFLRTPGLLARRPMLGLAMIVLGSIVFGAIAISLETNGLLQQWDVPLGNAIHAVALQSPPLTVDAMIFGFYLGEHVIFGIGILLGLYFIFKKFWPELVMVAVAWAGEGLLWLALSQFFHRARPVFDTPVWRQMTSPGFPSGHSFSAVMCYGLLAYLLVPMMPTRFGKVLVITFAVAIILVIDFSRMFIGDHYLTDVLAGFAVGVAWCGLAYTSVELIFKKRIMDHV